MSRSLVKILAPAAAVIGSLIAASPAFATDTTFATYTGLNGTFTATNSGSLITLSETGTVVFSFTNNALASEFTGIAANVLFTASAPTADFSGGKIVDQGGIAGTYLFTSKSAYTVNGITYAAGSNLLTVAFANGDLTGKMGGKTAALSADNTLGSTVMYSSSFLNFISTNTSDFSVSLSAIAPKFATATAVPSFTGSPVGVFSADPAPVVVGSVPEPATWAMMLIGFGAIGMGVRSNARRNLRTV